MSLATRCTACGTVFRVVQDQLKVSEGWVRCGRCDEVFNALEGLFDLEREPPPPGRLAAASSANKPGGPAPAAYRSSVDDSGWPLTGPGEAWEPSLADRVGADLLATVPGEPVPMAAQQPMGDEDTVEFSNARWDAELLTDVAAQDTQIASRAFDASVFDDDEEMTRLDPREAPEFVRRAERHARWSRPGVRVALGLLALMLMAGLVLQAGHHFRDTVAARWPQFRPALVDWCAAAKCTLEAPRRIEDISVESTSLARAGATTEALRLSVNLRNRGLLPLNVPSVDLKLTDGSGALISRRMLSPHDFGATVPSLAPGSDTHLQLLLSTGNQPISGYTVEVFYP